MSKTLKSIIKDKALPEVAIQEWRDDAEADKTRANFKSHFSKEVKNYQKIKVSQLNLPTTLQT